MSDTEEMDDPTDSMGYLMDACAGTLSPSHLIKVLTECAYERASQDRRFGDQTHKHIGAWFAILAEEFGEVSREICDIMHAEPDENTTALGERCRTELVQTMAVCAAFIEAGDRMGWDNWPDETFLRHISKEGNISSD